MREVRRIVGGNDPAGRSVILADTATASLTVAPGVEVVELWQSKGARVKLGDADLSPPLKVVFPPPGETAFRIIEFKNNDGASSLAGHDQAAILEGEITYITEGDEIVVCAGDAIIQLGNVHSWRNTSGASVLLAVVQAAADPLGR